MQQLSLILFYLHFSIPFSTQQKAIREHLLWIALVVSHRPGRRDQRFRDFIRRQQHLPVGVVAVGKQPEADLLAALKAVGSDIPEKLEGVAFGPSLVSSGRVALDGSDNDYSVTQSGAGEQFDVCVNLEAGTRSQVSLNTPCPDGSNLNPGHLLSFEVR